MGDKKIACLNIYPRKLGGIKVANMAESEVHPDAELWKNIANNGFYRVQVWDEEQNKLIPYYPLPETIDVSSDYVARMLSCPYTALKRVKASLADTLKGWIPAVVLIAAIIFVVIVGD